MSPLTRSIIISAALIELVLCGFLSLSAREHPSIKTRYEFLLPLPPGLTVFAYARVSPDGRYLVFSTQRGRNNNPSERTLQVVNLRTKESLLVVHGIDGYWAPDSERLIYLDTSQGRNISIWNRRTGDVVKDVAAPTVGDYFSWGKYNGQDIILTAQGKYFLLGSTSRAGEIKQVMTCPGIGQGERPLVSKDGKRVTVFVDGALAVRSPDDSRTSNTRTSWARKVAVARARLVDLWKLLGRLDYDN